MSAKIVLLIVALAVFSAGVLWLVVNHKTTVTDGQFQGLQIGVTKLKILEQLLLREDVNGVHPEPFFNFTVSSDNLDDAYKLIGQEVVIIVGENFSWQIRIENSVAREIIKLSHFDIPVNISVGDQVNQILEAIEEGILGGVIEKAFPSIVPHSEGLGGSTVFLDQNTLISDNNEIVWLLKYDHWVFTQTDKYTRFDLFFEGGTLRKIEYRNDFIELP